MRIPLWSWRSFWTFPFICVGFSQACGYKPIGSGTQDLEAWEPPSQVDWNNSILARLSVLILAARLKIDYVVLRR